MFYFPKKTTPKIFFPLFSIFSRDTSPQLSIFPSTQACNHLLFTTNTVRSLRLQSYIANHVRFSLYLISTGVNITILSVCSARLHTGHHYHCVSSIMLSVQCLFLSSSLVFIAGYQPPPKQVHFCGQSYTSTCTST